MSTLVFVHGWSVTDTSTYGELPATLAQRAAQAGGALRVLDIHLSEYVSFIDTVTMDDIVRAFDHALRGLDIPDGQFDCITHSTGGPVMLAWLRAQRLNPTTHAPLKAAHVIMLAPAHYGSALAQLGKGTVGRLKAWFNGIEPGQHVLDWLELGSPESLQQNLDVVHGTPPEKTGTWLFNLIGDRPDRRLYDVINSYTGEDGSDGVVRIAAANLNATHLVLTQQADGTFKGTSTRAPRIPFRLLPGLSHSGTKQGIMAEQPTTDITVTTILRCLAVNNAADYSALFDAFATENTQRDANKVELEPVGIFAPRVHIHDPRSMLIVRLSDDRGEAPDNAQFQLTAGPEASPDHLPPNFMIDRQANSRSPATFTLFLNHAVLSGDAAVHDPRDASKLLRAALPSHPPYGARVEPVDTTGLIHHVLGVTATKDDLLTSLGPHETTVIDVVLSRHVAEGVFRFTSKLTADDFHQPVPGPDIP